MWYGGSRLTSLHSRAVIQLNATSTLNTVGSIPTPRKVSITIRNRTAFWLAFSYYWRTFLFYFSNDSSFPSFGRYSLLLPL